MAKACYAARNDMLHHVTSFYIMVYIVLYIMVYFQVKILFMLDSYYLHDSTFPAELHVFFNSEFCSELGL